jgi:hypothetical protein
MSPPVLALDGADVSGGNLACSELIAELLLELLPPLLLLPPLELPELLDLLLEPQAASPIDTTARSTGKTPSNLDLDRIFLPFI